MKQPKTGPTTLQSIGEVALLQRILPKLPRGRNAILGSGDDCAVVRIGGQDLALTSDAVLEGRHFDADTAPARIGHKALARTLSDLAAMGAAPAWALVDLTAPGDTAVERIEGIYDGLCRLAGIFDMGILGGDTAEGTPLSLHVFAGGLLPAGTARTRGAVRPEDRLFVTGTLGGSFESGHHLDFMPRVPEGLFLRDRARAVIDLSDGLATDALHLARASGVCLELDAAALPVAGILRDRAPRESLRQVLCDGEDFELLFAVPPASADALCSQWRRLFPATRLSCIGRALAGDPGLRLRDGDRVRALTEQGFEHFR